MLFHSKTKKLLLLTLSFLILTVIIIAPAYAPTGTFGHTALGATRGLNGFPAVFVSAFKAPAEANNGVITEIVCALQTITGSGNAIPVVYAADGAPNQYQSNDPSTLLSTGPPVAITPTMQWRHMSLSTPITIQAGKTYYFGYLANVGTYPSQDYQNPPGTPTTIYEMELAGGWWSYPNAPAPFGDVTYVHAGINILAVYAVYTANASPPPPDDGNLYSLTMYTSGNGTVTPGNGTGYHLNDVVSLTATPRSGWSFQNWINATGGAATSITIRGNTGVTANFVAQSSPSTGSFGHLALGTTRGYMGSTEIFVSAYQAPSEANNGVMTEISCGIATISGSGFAVPVVYAADGKLNQYGFPDPGTLLAKGSPVPIDSSMGWRHMPLSSSVTIQSGKSYYIGYVANVGTYVSQDYSSTRPTSMFQWIIAGGYGTYPNPSAFFSASARFQPNSANVLAAYDAYTIGSG